MTTPVVFIANRGEIAVRISRAAHDLGMRTAAVHVDDDVDAPYVAMADAAERVPAAPNPFLDAELLVAAAIRAGADFVHPGYGFLAENAEFARRVVDAGLVWVGPSAEAIDALGDKVSARAIAIAVGAPLVEGTDGPVSGPEDVRGFADRVGYPIAIKASHGGGGRGMRIVRFEGEIATQFASAESEAVAAFGNGECFAEQYLDRPRHVETQCLADAHGNVVVVGTRDCSVQRRHQKLFEEAPAPGLTAVQLATLTDASRRILRHVDYRGAATCEFLVSRDGAISFLEVNTRIQVEHTVTEVVSGVDLVEQQFRIARGEELAIADNVAHGVAVEYRINSEDATLGFLPSAGTIVGYAEPSGPWVRVDSGVRAGSPVTGAFDSMLAKLIVWGATRDQALDRSRRALREFAIEGVATTVPFFRVLVDEPSLRRHGGPGGVYTSWVEQELLEGDVVERMSALAPPLAPASFARVPAPADGRAVTLRIDGRPVTIELPDDLPGALFANQGGSVRRQRIAPRIEGINVRTVDAEAPGFSVTAPAHGIVVAVHTTEGASVGSGDPLVTIEVMKMEHTVRSPAAGRVEGLVPLAAQVAAGDALLQLV